MLSIIITAYKEEKTIGKVIECLVDKNYSGLGKNKIDKDWEIIVIAPDKRTKLAAEKKLQSLNIQKSNYRILTDQGIGKPAALNLCFKKAKGDWLLLTDGDVIFSKNAIFQLVKKASEEDLGGVTGRPFGAEPKNSMLNYWGALLADAAHHKRTIDLTTQTTGKSRRFIRKREFFPLSGYIMLIKNLDLRLPEDTLIDDAYISYELFNKGYRLGYAPAAKVAVKYPTTLSDYFKQKKRSTGGYVQLWKYGIVKPETKSRNFWRELEYFWFPIKYAKNLKELIWSLCLYPARLWLWIMIYWERKIIKKDFSRTWVRIETTK
jgi:cellulose synthase/poly-beta-1,6-N-acetylglucosamine synthase-like glycosyltransferase